MSSQNPLIQQLVPDVHQSHAHFLLLVEVEAQHVAGREVPVVQVLADLPLAVRVVARAAPDLQLDDVLLPQVVHDNVGAGLVPSLVWASM
jgi:hypothetical protein